MGLWQPGMDLASWRIVASAIFSRPFTAIFIGASISSAAMHCSSLQRVFPMAAAEAETMLVVGEDGRACQLQAVLRRWQEDSALTLSETNNKPKKHSGIGLA